MLKCGVIPVHEHSRISTYLFSSAFVFPLVVLFVLTSYDITENTEELEITRNTEKIICKISFFDVLDNLYRNNGTMKSKKLKSTKQK